MNPDVLKAIDPMAGTFTYDETGEHYSTACFEDAQKEIERMYQSKLDGRAYYVGLPSDAGEEEEREIELPTRETFERLDRVILYGAGNVDALTDFILLKDGRTIATFTRDV